MEISGGEKGMAEHQEGAFVLIIMSVFHPGNDISCSLLIEDQQKMGLRLGPCSIQNSREVDCRASNFPYSSSYKMTSISGLI
eukprot:5811631-Ditylum_brightwellii.AAC.1